MVLAVTNMALEDPHWKDLRLFARSLKPGSPEHAAAHRNLLNLVVAKETDFAPWRDGTARAIAGRLHLRVPSFRNAGRCARQRLGGVHEPEFAPGRAANVRASGLRGV